jgi:hypothetical protein
MPKAGKSTAAAMASASPLIDRTFWFTFGEPKPNELGLVEGARFEIVKYDGTYRGLITAMEEAAAEPMDPAKPHLWIIDSGSRIWQTLSDEGQVTANRRWAKKNASKDLPDDGIRVPMDLWNVAKSRWGHILKLVNDHQGPTIITSRMEKVAVVDNRGEPTKEKIWKVQAEKNLPFEVDAVIELHAVGEAYLTGVRSMRWQQTAGKVRYPDFTMHDLWTKLGLADQPAGRREFVGATAEESLAADELVIAHRIELIEQIKEAAKIARVTAERIQEKWREEYHHELVETTNLGGLAKLRDELKAFAKRDEVPMDQVA